MGSRADLVGSKFQEAASILVRQFFGHGRSCPFSLHAILLLLLNRCSAGTMLGRVSKPPIGLVTKKNARQRQARADPGLGGPVGNHQTVKKLNSVGMATTRLTGAR